MARSRVLRGVFVLLIALSAACSGSEHVPDADAGSPKVLPDDGEQRGTGLGGPGTVGADISPGAAPEVYGATTTSAAPSHAANASNAANAPASGPEDVSSPPELAVDPPSELGVNDASVPPSVLTAGTWDDNRNFDRFLTYRQDLWDRQVPGLLPFTQGDHESARDASPASLVRHGTLDVALVVDTTGSMGDELRYLQAEFDALSQTIANKYPNADQRWALVVYRDTSDDYVTRWFDFRTDLAVFRANLTAQSASGGGDFPEAPDQGLNRAAQLSWRTEADTAKLAFWVADAPHHEDRAQAMHDAIATLQASSIHVYPVSSSGIDELTEITMRSTAQLTLGRYLFLTDDSGIGDPHREPTIPCYFVTKLDAAILRMVDIEMTGNYHEPLAREILRTGGNPQDGACQLPSGEKVVAF